VVGNDEREGYKIVGIGQSAAKVRLGQGSETMYGTSKRFYKSHDEDIVQSEHNNIMV
jgi:hypothetical protein